MLRCSRICTAGVSAMSLYTPAHRVHLEQWCAWTNQPWEKVSSVVGSSFRIPHPQEENVYSMCATAVIRLIVQNEVDPTQVGFLGLGTESSTDNAVGAVIVRGLVDSGLQHLGLPPLSRHIEVPEFKQACLAGVYGMKAAARYCSLDGKDKLAIVVCGDIAEYERGSSGEPTQGSGAVAMLIEDKAKMFELDLFRSGSASQCRGPDFRKPFLRHRSSSSSVAQERKCCCANGCSHVSNVNLSSSSSCVDDGNDAAKNLSFTPNNGHHQARRVAPDFPVFSGTYSTLVYVDAVAHAVDEMLRKMEVPPSQQFQKLFAVNDRHESNDRGDSGCDKLGGDNSHYDDDVMFQGVFLHRPYQMMPVQAMSVIFVRALARSAAAAEVSSNCNDNKEMLLDLCKKANVSYESLQKELNQGNEDYYRLVVEEGRALHTIQPATTAVARALREASSSATCTNLFSSTSSSSSLSRAAASSFKALVEKKMSVGSSVMAQMGNLYSASLPWCIAAGLEEEAMKRCRVKDDSLSSSSSFSSIHSEGKEKKEKGALLRGEEKPWLMIGYGSGDAAEAIPFYLVPGWETQAVKMNVATALEGAVDLDRQEYEALHMDQGDHNTTGHVLPPCTIPNPNISYSSRREGGGDEKDACSSFSTGGITPSNNKVPSAEERRGMIRRFVIDRVGDRNEGPGLHDLGMPYYRMERNEIEMR